MRLNNKGFSLVELLGVVVILGVLMGVGFQAYDRYVNKTKTEGYDILAESSMNAFEQYLLDHPFASQVSIDTLVKDNYLENVNDPGNKGGKCTGLVKKASTEEDSEGLKKNTYELELCCANKNYHFDSDGSKEEKATCGVHSGD